MKKHIIFFIGTTAEYIKVFTVMEWLKNNSNIPVTVITSGQNDISKTDIARRTGLKIDLQLSEEKDIVKNAFGLFSWFFKTKRKAVKIIKERFSEIDFKNSIIVVHGDTLSTVMGALIGKKLGAKVAHIEAGLRSHNIFSPFPEEIDRNIVSKIASFNFCQDDLSESNLSSAKGKVVNTHYNTIIDALHMSEDVLCKNKAIASLTSSSNYAVFVLHRQENLLKTQLVKDMVHLVTSLANKNLKVVFILHTITKNTLVKMDLLKTLQNTDNVVLFNRVEYFDFMKLLQNAQFVITDGGSNQEELAYMGIPTMIVRTSTERQDGLGQNAIMYEGKIENINKFTEEFGKYRREKTICKKSPSETISKTLEKVICSSDRLM